MYGTDDHIKPPVVSKRVNPSYTAAAMRAKIQGKVIMQAVVQADGTVSDVRVTRSLDRKRVGVGNVPGIPGIPGDGGM